VQHLARDGASGGAICSPLISSRPPLSAYSRSWQVDAGAEELHLLAHPHRRHAAGDGAVVAPLRRIRSSLSYWIELVSIEVFGESA
jgi:hypothetical protein